MPRRRLRLALALPLCLAAALPPAAEAQRGDAERHRSRLDTTFAFNRGGLVDLGQVGGDIEVTSWERDEVRIRAWAEHGRLESSLSPTRAWLRVEAEAQSGRNRRIGESGYEVTVPAGVRVKVASVSGDLRVRRTGGEVEATTTSGDVVVSDARATTVGTVSGDVVVSRLDGDLAVRSVSGDVVARDVRGDVRAATVSGDLDLRGVAGRAVAARTTSGDVVFEGAFADGGRYDFQSHAGDVMLGLAGEVNAEMTVQTFSGELNTAFPVTLAGGARRTTSTRSLEFTLGRGGARVRVETFSGDVVLRRAGDSPERDRR